MVGAGAAEGMAVVLFGIKGWRFDGCSVIAAAMFARALPGALSARFPVVAPGFPVEPLDGVVRADAPPMLAWHLIVRQRLGKTVAHDFRRRGPGRGH